jgi:hypothetical protein
MYLRRNFQIRDCKIAFFYFSQAIYWHDQSAGLQSPYAANREFALMLYHLPGLAFVPIQNVQDYFNHLVEKPETVFEDAHHPSLLPQFTFCITSSENIAQFQGRLSYNFRTAVYMKQ